MAEWNQRLRYAREHTPSRRTPGACVGRQELAELVNEWLYTQRRRITSLDKNYIGKLERGQIHWPDEPYRAALRAILGAATDTQLGFYDTRRMPTHLTAAHRQEFLQAAAAPNAGLSSPGRRDGVPADEGTGGDLRPLRWPTMASEQVADAEGDDTNRRHVLAGSGAGLLGVATPGLAPERCQPQKTVPAAIDSAAAGATPLDALVAAVTGYGEAAPHAAATVDSNPGAAVAGVKRAYQGGRYRQVVDSLPGLLWQLTAAQAIAAGQQRPQIQAMAADAYQVTCSVLLKQGDVPLAVLAADRSRAAAEASGDPLATAASARAVTHALLAGGHHRQATTFALAAADQLRHAVALSAPAAVSLYGALLLRAAVAAANGEDRSTALRLLEEARAYAAGLGHDGNAYWTYFNPVNVDLHQVHVATSLGDAGQAIDCAQRIDLALIPLAERRACLLIDVARAYTQWGKHEPAYQALRAAEQAAFQEVAYSRSVRGLVHDLEQRAPVSVKLRVRQFADQIGALA